MKNKNRKKDFIHTGDVQAVESSLPASAKKIEKKPVAYGEKSGHQHVITGDYEMFEDKENVYVKVGKGGAWSQHVHESVMKHANYDTQELLEKADHKPARLLPNKTYKVGIHQAYNPYKKIQERVID
jgi:hypothetical protein